MVTSLDIIDQRDTDEHRATPLWSQHQEPSPRADSPTWHEPGQALERHSPLESVRAFGVVVGPSLLFDLLAAGSLTAVARGELFKRRTGVARLVRPLVALGAAAPAVYLLALRPWHLRWGATGAEVRAPLPGDDLQPRPGIESTRAVTIDAPVDAVWPWLAQIGQDRGGFYSYEWLENLAGCRLRNADRIHPEWQQREIGETVLLHPAVGLPLARFEPGRVLALAGWGAFVLQPLDDGRTRLFARSRTGRGLSALLYALFIEIPHFVMERKMLLGIKARAERAAAR
jgi:hypothetical protein